MRAGQASLIGILLIMGLMLGGASAQAQWHFGVTGGIYEPDEADTGRTEFYGIRGGYRFSYNPRLGLEGSLTWLDLADTVDLEDDPFFSEFGFELDVTNFDLSLQWFPRGGRFAVFGGPGLARFDAEVSATIFGERVSESGSSTSLTTHVGAEYVWEIGDRFFIRPEARVRRYFYDDFNDSGDEGLDVSYKSTDYEAGVTFGWRF